MAILYRPGRKRRCYKHNHQWHDIFYDGIGFSDPVMLCSKCGMGKDIIAVYYEKRAWAYMTDPLFFYPSNSMSILKKLPIGA